MTIIAQCDRTRVVNVNSEHDATFHVRECGCEVKISKYSVLQRRQRLDRVMCVHHVSRPMCAVGTGTVRTSARPVRSRGCSDRKSSLEDAALCLGHGRSYDLFEGNGGAELEKIM